MVHPPNFHPKIDGNPRYCTKNLAMCPYTKLIIIINFFLKKIKNIKIKLNSFSFLKRGGRKPPHLAKWPPQFYTKMLREIKPMLWNSLRREKNEFRQK